jgi:SEC-C motif-containing protein
VPHAHHFLERLDRVRRDQVDFALALYRDHEAVKYVLERVKLPTDAPRVALAIDDPREGPFVIVTRSGQFVTCLGLGMSPDPCPVVPRGQIDALLAKLADRRVRRQVAAREMRPHEDEDDFLGRVFTRGARLAREEFLAVSAFESMLGIEPFLMMVDLSAEVVHSRPAIARIRKVAGDAARALEAYHRLEWSVAHLALLSAAAERKDLDRLLAAAKEVGQTPSFLCAVQAGQTFLLRGAWMAARLGKGILPSYRGALSSARDWLSMFDAALGVGAVALRHAGAAAEAKRILLAHVSAGKEKPDDVEAVGRAFFAEWVDRVADNVEESTRQALRMGQEVCVSYGSTLIAGHALRFERAEDVPEDLARTAMLAFDGDVLDEKVQGFTLAALPIAARAAAEDFYFPREVLRAWFGAWTGAETIERVKRFARTSPKREPARAAPIPGRNDPCPCGSGKKWKRCCGAAI